MKDLLFFLKCRLKVHSSLNCPLAVRYVKFIALTRLFATLPGTFGPLNLYKCSAVLYRPYTVQLVCWTKRRQVKLERVPKSYFKSNFFETHCMDGNSKYVAEYFQVFNAI